MSLTLDLLKQRQLEKQNKNIYSTKKIESEILIELKEKLEEHLLENDRVMLEIFRGCIRGCRFCQAGYIYRPVREKSKERVEKLAESLINNTGYEEISLTSPM